MQAEKFMPEATTDQRLAILRDNSDRIESGSYSRKITPEELNQLREDYTDASVIINELEEELREYSKDAKARIKAEKDANKETLKKIRQKFELKTGNIFYFVDYEEGMVSGYDF